MKVAVFLLLSFYCVLAQNISTTLLAPSRTAVPSTASPLPSPSPSPVQIPPIFPTATPVAPPPNNGCVFVNFSCGGLSTTNRSFSLVDICAPLLNQEVAGTCRFVFRGRVAVGFACPNIFGLQMALLCIPPNIPPTTGYCFCPELPSIRVAEVPDIRFLNASAVTVNENEGTLTICAVAGQLAEEIVPLRVTISTASGTAINGTDFVDPAQRISFSQSGQISCADVEILRDNTDELNETFTMELIFNYAPFDLPLDSLEVTIVDSDSIGVGFEQEAYVGTVYENSGSVSVCVISNVTLNGSRTAAAILQTQDVSAHAGSDYFATHEPIVFRVNGDRRICVDIAIYDDFDTGEFYEVFLVKLRAVDAPLFTDETIVVILDQDQLYPFGGAVGDAAVPSGIVVDTTSPPLTLSPRFRFFGRDEDTIYVNTNGVLTFDQPFHVPMPRPFPDNSLKKISPYWENFDTSRSGRIYYRNTTDITLLRRAQYHLQDIFPSARGFLPSYLFIATWDSAQELGLSGDTSLDNTFQVVMATDGAKSFVFFTYTDIQWGEATIGFDAGDGMRSFTLPGSRTVATRDIERMSNVGVAGVYAFRVDLPEIVGPGDCGGQVGVIRLFNGSSVLNGEVEYCLNSTWTPVCGDDWEESEAAVACRQLGFVGEGANVSREEAGNLIALTGINCAGTENNLLECTESGTLTSSDTCQYLARVSCTAVQIGFKQDSYAVRESDGTVTVCVNSTTRTFNVPVTLETLDIGTAQAGMDYNASSANFIFDGDPQEACIRISIINDDLTEQNETFLVVINTTVTSQTVSLNPAYAFVIITDDETQVPIGAIVGGVVGGTVLVCLIVAGVIIFAVVCSRKRKQKYTTTKTATTQEDKVELKEKQ